MFVLDYFLERRKQGGGLVGVLTFTVVGFHCYSDGSFAIADLWSFLSDGDFKASGKRPTTWKECILGLRDEMANHVVIRSAASFFFSRC